MWNVVRNGINFTIGGYANSSTAESKDGNKNVTSTPTPAITLQELAKREVLNVKVLYSLYCTLFSTEYNGDFSCETIKEIWDRL